MLGLILFIMCLYSLVIGSLLYIFVGFFHKPINGGWEKADYELMFLNQQITAHCREARNLCPE